MTGIFPDFDGADRAATPYAKEFVATRDKQQAKQAPDAAATSPRSSLTMHRRRFERAVSGRLQRGDL